MVIHLKLTLNLFQLPDETGLIAMLICMQAASKIFGSVNRFLKYSVIYMIQIQLKILFIYSCNDIFSWKS